MFQDAPSDMNLICRKIAVVPYIGEGTIEIGIYPVLYGFRIRAGFVGDMGCDLDFCAGNKQKDAEDIYSLVLTILERKLRKLGAENATGRTIKHRESRMIVFNDFPIQRTKPMYNDHECFMTLSEMCGPDLISIKLPDLGQEKLKYMLEHFPEMIGIDKEYSKIWLDAIAKKSQTDQPA